LDTGRQAPDDYLFAKDRSPPDAWIACGHQHEPKAPSRSGARRQPHFSRFRFWRGQGQKPFVIQFDREVTPSGLTSPAQKLQAAIDQMLRRQFSPGWLLGQLAVGSSGGMVAWTRFARRAGLAARLLYDAVFWRRRIDEKAARPQGCRHPHDGVDHRSKETLEGSHRNAQPLRYLVYCSCLADKEG